MILEGAKERALWRGLLSLILCAIMVVGTIVAAVRQSRPAAAQNQQYSAINLATNLVSLSVAVTDHSGKAIRGLEKEDFKVYDNGLEQSITFFSVEESPVSWGLVLDSSSSMERSIHDVYQAALDAIDEGTYKDEMFIVTFSDRAEVVCDFTSDRQKLENSAGSLHAEGNTALYDAVVLALDHIKSGKHKKKVLVVVTDGEDNNSRIRFRQLVERAKEADVMIYTIGIFSWRMWRRAAPGDLKKLAEISGAAAHFPDSTEKRRETMMEIASEVTCRYSIGYYPSNPMSDGKWRKVRIAVTRQKSGAKYAVRARTGYFALRGEVK